ncbi:hypothetical protein BLOT_012196 [Blomia tropicalis]|nr:hypothetical protein BLOT_012196 [Blomia tropicalis]
MRFMTMLYLMRNEFKLDTRLPYKINRDDLFLSYLYQNKERYGEEIIFILLAILLFNFICLDALYRLNVNTLTWHWWYELIVTNQDDYYQFHVKNIRLVTMAKSTQIAKHMTIHTMCAILPNYMIKIIANFYSRFIIQYNLEYVDKEKYFDKKFTIIPNISFQIRLKLIKTLIMWDIISCFSQMSFVLLITAFYWMCAKQMDNSALAWNAYVWINVEYVLCIYLAFQCIQNAMFFTFCTITGTIVFCGHVIETNQTVWKLIDKYRSHNSMLSWIPFLFRRIIVNQLVEHNRVTYLVISGSRELFGYVLYAYLLTNIPINVYIIRRNLYETQEFKDQLILYVIAFLQLLAAIIVFIPLAWCAKIYHSPAMFIPILQPMFRNQHGWLLYKMKLRLKLINVLIIADRFVCLFQLFLETNQIIWKLIGKYRSDNSKLLFIPLQCQMILSNQLKEHNRITYIVIGSSRELFGYINYVFLLTNIPINVYTLRRNLYVQQTLQDQILLWTLVLIQLLTFLIVFIPPSWCTKVNHSPAKFIPILQPMIQRPKLIWFKYKMKYDDLYYRLIDNGPKLGMTIGPVRAITYMTSFEVLFMYIAMELDVIIKLIANLYSRMLIQYNLEHIDKKKFIEKKLSALPTLSRGLRLKLINILIISDNFACLVQFILETNRIIWKLIDNCQLNKYRIINNSMFSSIPFSCRNIIKNQLIEHNLVIYIVISSSRELFGYINYVFLLTNVPINVYILRRNLFEPQKVLDQIILWTLALVQMLSFLIVFIPPSRCTKVYHSPAKFIPTLVPMLRGSSCWIKYKMKYEDLYHRLIDNGPKLALTVGPMRAITYLTSLEVLSMYFAYVLMAFKQLNDANMKNNVLTI